MKKGFDYALIAFGAFFIAFGVNVFLVPCKITTGGVSGIGTVLFYFLSVPISLTNIAINAVLFVFGYRQMGKKSLFKTVFGIVSLTLFLEVCAHIPVYTEDILVATLAGGAALGAGLGIVVRVDGSTGGSDFAGIMIHKRVSHISIANIILFIDLIIIALSGIVFGSITITLYSALSLFVATKICDLVISFGNAAKEIQIVSDKSREIASEILTRFQRGVTGIRSIGMYSGKSTLMLYCVVSPRELPRLAAFVRQADPEAFIVTNDVRQVMGRGFKN